MFKYRIFIFSLLVGRMCVGSTSLEPMEMFSCHSNDKIIGYESPDLKSKSIKIECQNIVSSHPAVGPGPEGPIVFYSNRLIWGVDKKSSGWLKVKLEDSKKFYWISQKEAVFKKSIETVKKHFSNHETVYALFGQWNGKLYKRPNSKEIIDTYIRPKIVGDYNETVRVNDIQEIDGKIWFKVQLYDDDLCDPPKPPSETYSGWVHLLNDNDEPIIGEAFCG